MSRMHAPGYDDRPAPFTERFAAWCIRHAPAIVFGAVVLGALPYALDAMEIQLLDNEFFASLCGFAGWGKGAN